MGFKFSLITSIITVLGILLVLIGLYWYKSALLHKPICKGFFSDIIFK